MSCRKGIGRKDSPAYNRYINRLTNLLAQIKPSAWLDEIEIVDTTTNNKETAQRNRTEQKAVELYNTILKIKELQEAQSS